MVIRAQNYDQVASHFYICYALLTYQGHISFIKVAQRKIKTNHLHMQYIWLISRVAKLQHSVDLVDAAAIIHN